MATSNPPQEQRQAFYFCGEAAWQECLRTGVATPAEAVFARLDERVERRRRQLADQALSCPAEDWARSRRP